MTDKKTSFVIYSILVASLVVCTLFFLQPTKAFSEPVTGNPLPRFSIPALYNSNVKVTNRNLAGQVYLLNFFASSCSACQQEHALLLLIKNTAHVPIYGINYKDNTDNTRLWLSSSGNPYALIGVDEDGYLGDQLQVQGTPVTFIIDKKGIIRYQYVGMIDADDWRNIILPLIKQYEAD